MFPKNFYAIVQKLISMATSLEADWMLIGAVPVAAWGEPRATTDVDFTISIGRKWSPELDRIMKRLGFKKVRGPGEIVDSGLFLSQYWVGKPKGDPDQGVGIDVFFTESEWQQEAINRRVSAQIGAKVYWIASPEDLLIYKILAFRDKDLNDIAGLMERQYKKLDWGYVRRWCADLGISADLEDLVEQFMDEKKIKGSFPWEE